MFYYGDNITVGKTNRNAQYSIRNTGFILFAFSKKEKRQGFIYVPISEMNPKFAANFKNILIRVLRTNY